MATVEQFNEIKEAMEKLEEKVKQNTSGDAYTAGKLKTLEEVVGNLKGKLNETIDTINEQFEGIKDETKLEDINTSIEHINADIAEIKRLDNIDKQNIDRQHHKLNDIEENKIKELENKINEGMQDKDQVDGKIQDIKEQVDEEIRDIKEKMAQLAANAQSALPEGRQPLTVHYGQGGERSVDEKLHELEGRLDEKIDSVTEKVIELKNNGSKGENRGDKLNNLKDTTVQKIAENASNADVINWVDDLTLHIDGATGWSNTGAIFKALKSKKESLLDPDVMNELIDTVTDPEFDKSKFYDSSNQCSERNRELFKYVFPKLSNKLKTLCCNTNGTQNGLGVVRLIIREHDPTGENIATGLEQRFTNKLRQGKCKTLEASRNKAKEL